MNVKRIFAVLEAVAIFDFGSFCITLSEGRTINVQLLSQLAFVTHLNI